MSEYRAMTYEETLEELEFAMEHSINFTKHNLDRLLSKDDVERMARRLGIVAEYRACFMDDSRAYYVLSFNSKTNKHNLATYFGKDVISQCDGYVIDGANYGEVDVN